MELKQIFSTYSKEENVDFGQFKYCPFCGTCLVLKEKGGKQRPDCPDCEFVQFRNPAPGVVVVIEKDKHVLLGKRKGGLGKGKWGLPQGYADERIIERYHKAKLKDGLPVDPDFA
jgi:hypothetical protein